jgi:hypothetical protein
MNQTSYTRVMVNERLADGFTAELYVWGENKVLKLFKPNFSEPRVRNEALVSGLVAQSGLGPEVGEIIEINGRWGIIYERVFGVSMLEQLKANPENVSELARLCSILHVKVHQIKNVEGIPSRLERLAHKLSRVDLPPELRQGVLNLLKDLPVVTSLCHGDFHPSNIMLTKKEPVVIDWADVSLGSPLADVARTLLLLKGVRLWGDKVMKELILCFEKVYLGHYFTLSPGDSSELKAWYPIVAAERMSEGHHDLNSWLINEVREGLEQ